MYHVYLGGMLCPVTPDKILTKIANNNKVITLINEGQVNILKDPALTEMTFELLLPNQEYSFAVYKHGFEKADYFLTFIEELKKEKKVFSVLLVRKSADERILYHSALVASLEDYTISESVSDETDIRVQIKLKQYRDYGTKTYKISNGKAVLSGRPRNTSTSPAPKTVSKTYKVQNGDCLWSIAKRFYGDGSKWTKIASANRNKLVGQNAVVVGTILTIPV